MECRWTSSGEDSASALDEIAQWPRHFPACRVDHHRITLGNLAELIERHLPLHELRVELQQLIIQLHEITQLRVESRNARELLLDPRQLTAQLVDLGR